MNKKFWRSGNIIILATIIFGCLFYLYQSYKKAPSDLTFKIIDGRQLSLEQYHGKPVLVDFWSTSCKSCLEETPDLIAIYNELSEQGLEIIGVAMPYDRPDLVLQAAEQLKIPYPIALDIDGVITSAFGNITVTPTHFLIAPDGKIAQRIVGTIDPVKLRDKIKTMLPKEVI